jgi:dihydrofolate reductase/thymidylate synthase
MSIEIIVAFSTKNLVIGKDGQIPWDIPEDLKHFAEITKDSIVVMGRKTYESIPSSIRPLKNRLNLVITSTPTNYQNIPDQLQYLSPEDLKAFMTTHQDKRFCIIGGAALYQEYLGKAHKIHSTQIDKKYDGDVFFPTENFDKYEITGYSENKYSASEQCNYRYIEYTLTDKPHDEYVYLNLLKDIMQNGNTRPDRTKIGTKSVFSRQIRFDISNSVPFTTTKHLAYKAVIKELLFFLKGQTDSKVLETEGVNIWRDNTTREFLDNRGLTSYREGDMGPMYGFQWFHMGASYEGCDADYKNKGYNQMANLIKNLKEDPFSRRHLLTTYNPADVSKSVLAPCHGIAIMFYVEEIDNQKHLSCHTVIRSSDSALGLPFNIASYAILTYIIAAQVDMKPKELVISTGDSHIYLNHINALEAQLTRTPFPKPVLIYKTPTKLNEEITIDDFEVIGYLAHPAIKMAMAI